MKILYVITGLGGGGAEKVVAGLADEMSKLGHQVKIAYLKGKVIVSPENSEIELINLGLESVKNSKVAYKNYKQLLRKFQPDVVHAHMVHANIFARISRLFFPIPKLICTAHSNNEGGKGRMLAYRLTHHLSDLTTNVSLSASKNFEALGAVPKHGITTVYNGIDLKRFSFGEENKTHWRKKLSINSSEKIFLAVGRFHEAKDYPNLLTAFSILKNNPIFNQKQPILLVAGDGDLREEIELMIKSLNLNTDVILLGRRNDIPDLLNISDFFVLSSKYEGLPTVVMEAMACGAYVIATECGGSSEIMGETGVLVPIQNSVALANAFDHVLKLDQSQILNNNKMARIRVEEMFSLKKSVSEWLKLYEQ